MFGQYFSQVTQLKPDEISTISQVVDESIGDIPVEEENFVMLEKLVQGMSHEELYKYRNSYTYWYAIYGWDLVNSLSLPQFAFLVSHSSGVGLLLGEDVWRRIVSYLHLRSIDEVDMQEKYQQIRAGFLSSEEIIYHDEKTQKFYTIKDFVADIQRFDRVDEDVESAEFFSHLEMMINRRISEGNFSASGFDVVSLLRELANFFVGIDREHIWYVVDPYFYPQQYEQLQTTAGEGTSRSTPNTSFEIIQNVETPDVRQQIMDTSADEDAMDITSKSYSDIRTQLSAQYASLDADEQTEKIIHALHELAEQYNDPRILDLYYFDESSGNFVWNDELLASPI